MSPQTLPRNLQSLELLKTFGTRLPACPYHSTFLNVCSLVKEHIMYFNQASSFNKMITFFLAHIFLHPLELLLTGQQPLIPFRGCCLLITAQTSLCRFAIRRNDDNTIQYPIYQQPSN